MPMKSEKMVPPMNSRPAGMEEELDGASEAGSKLQEFLDGCSEEECRQLMEMLEEKMQTDIEGDEEAGESPEHKAKVLGDEEPLEE